MYSETFVKYPSMCANALGAEQSKPKRCGACPRQDTLCKVLTKLARKESADLLGSAECCAARCPG